MSGLRNSLIVVGTIAAALAAMLKKAYKMGEEKLKKEEDKSKKE